MPPIQIEYKGTYRDGGTEMWLVYFKEDPEEYCVDQRYIEDPKNPEKAVKVATAGQWFKGYPQRGNSNLVEDQKLLELLNDLRMDYISTHDIK